LPRARRHLNSTAGVMPSVGLAYAKITLHACMEQGWVAFRRLWLTLGLHTAGHFPLPHM